MYMLWALNVSVLVGGQIYFLKVFFSDINLLELFDLDYLYLCLRYLHVRFRCLMFSVHSALKSARRPVSVRPAPALWSAYWVANAHFQFWSAKMNTYGAVSTC